jgi:hypothetical protein
VYIETAQKISVQQQTLTFYMYGHFLFMGEYFLHNNFLQIRMQKLADCFKNPGILTWSDLYIANGECVNTFIISKT